MAGQRYYGRRRAYTNLKAEIDDFILESEDRMIRLMRQSVADVVDNAQTSTAKGGRMRVDTGFLRASGQMSLTGMPSGPARGAKDATKHQYDSGGGDWSKGSNVTEKLSKAKLGDTIYFGWTANYARYRELYDGFLEGALMQWARIVAFNIDTIRQRVKK